MKKFLKAAGIIICVLVSAGYIMCSLTPYVSPAKISFFSTLALVFPYAFATMILLVILHCFINRKVALLLLCIAALGYKNIFSTFALHPATGWHDKKDSNNLRILTWNVLNFTSIYQYAKEADAWPLYTKKIKEWNPDVLCFQEYKNIELAIKFNNVRSQLDSLGFKYYYCSNDFVAKSKGWKGIYGCAIYSKIPIVDSSKMLILKNDAGQDESLISADINFQGKRIRVFTGHLASFELRYSSYQEKGLYDETIERRRYIYHKIKTREIIHEEQVKKIRAQISQSPYPVIYCGDINSMPASYTYHSLKSSLQDVFIKTGFGMGKTFSRFGPSMRIDMCFVDNKFKVKQCAIPKDLISDHFPVIADIQWKE